jgi:glycerophosphoryl diester phosphodiesterase
MTWHVDGEMVRSAYTLHSDGDWFLLGAELHARVTRGSCLRHRDGVRPRQRAAMRVIGHRGTPSHPTYPENTLAAVRTALQAGVDGVEVDVRATEDGVLVLAHDGDLGRVLGTGAGTGPASVCVPAVGEPAPSGGGSDRGWDGWPSFSADAWSVAR